MNNAGLVAVCACVFLGLAWGCDKSGKPTAEAPQAHKLPPAATAQPEPPQAEPTQTAPPGDADLQTVTYGGEGEDSQVSYGGENVGLPQGWPEFLVVYEGAKLINAQHQKVPAGTWLSIGFETQDSIELPMGFYEKLLLDEGYKLTEAGSLEGHMNYRFTSEKRGVDVQCMQEELRTVVYVNTWIVAES